MADRKLVRATKDMTVHMHVSSSERNGRKFEQVDAVVLSPESEPVALDALSEGQREAVEAGEVDGLEVVSEKEVEEARKARAKELAEAGERVEVGVGESAVAKDNSFSDHLVSDVERAENHARRGVEEAGEDSPEDAVSVAGASSEESPAHSGRETRDDVGAGVDDPNTAEDESESGNAESSNAKKSSSKKSK